MGVQASWLHREIVPYTFSLIFRLVQLNNASTMADICFPKMFFHGCSVMRRYKTTCFYIPKTGLSENTKSTLHISIYWKVPSALLIHLCCIITHKNILCVKFGCRYLIWQPQINILSHLYRWQASHLIMSEKSNHVLLITTFQWGGFWVDFYAKA